MTETFHIAERDRQDREDCFQDHSERVCTDAEPCDVCREPERLFEDTDSGIEDQRYDD